MNIFRIIDRDLERPGVPNAMLAIVYWGVTMVVGLWVVGVLTGCVKIEPEKATNATTNCISPGGYLVCEVRLSDGTRCAFSAGSGTGITCDWQNSQRSEAQGVEK